MKNMFSKIFKKPQEQAKEEMQREVECMQAIGAVLQSYNCRLEAVLKGDAKSIFADIQVTALPALPKPTNDPGQPTTNNAIGTAEVGQTEEATPQS